MFPPTPIALPDPTFAHITDADYAALPPVVQRFLRYVQINTQADPHSKTVPSSACQLDLSRLLGEELEALGAHDVAVEPTGYVYATIPSSGANSPSAPAVGLLAHVDTSPDAPGAGVEPVLHPDYDGGLRTLPGDPSVQLDPERSPALRAHTGETLISSDGRTLLGSDDKAGVAILMQLAADLLADAEHPRPPLRLCFTVDEEIGRGVDHLYPEHFDVPVAYTIDGSGLDAIYAETFNAAEATLTIEGVMVHPGYAKGIMVNALRILGEALAALPAGEAPETTDGRDGYIHPHTLTHADAGSAKLVLILRDFTDEGMAQRKALLHELARSLQERHPRARIDLRIRDQYKNMRRYIEETDPRVLTFAHRAAASMGIHLEEKLVRGGTDGARLSERGIPTPNVFNGGHDYHSRFEWNTVESLEHALAYCKELVQVWAGAP